jgi:hypothetical protein
MALLEICLFLFSPNRQAEVQRLLPEWHTTPVPAIADCSSVVKLDVQRAVKEKTFAAEHFLSKCRHHQQQLKLLPAPFCEVGLATFVLIGMATMVLI